MADPKTSSLRFTRLRLINWRNFRDVEVRLAPRAFLVGPNASGKSNFLDAIRFLRDLVQPGGGLQAAVDRRGGLSKLRCLHARRINYIEIDADIGHDTNPTIWSYRLRFSMVGSGINRTVSMIEEEARNNGNPVFIEKRTDNPDDPQRFTQTTIEQISQNRLFRPVADFFASIRYLHVVPQIVRDPRRASTDQEDPFGGDLLRRMKEVPKKTRDPRLRRISQALQIAVPQFVNLQLENDPEGHPHLYASYAHWRPSASKQGEETFSDGTLRLIGFLWSIAERGGPLLLEEPELSLNDAVVSQLPAMIARVQSLSGRQIIATTHSEALLSADGVGLHEVHRLIVDSNGTSIQTASDDEQTRMLVASGWKVGGAVLPLTKPGKFEQLGFLDVLSR